LEHRHTINNQSESSSETPILGVVWLDYKNQITFLYHSAYLIRVIVFLFISFWK